MAKHSKRLRAQYEGIDRQAPYDVGAAISLTKTKATAKFDETVEVALNLGVDPRHAEQKMADLNAKDMEGAIAMIVGSARSMGIEVVE